MKDEIKDGALIGLAVSACIIGGSVVIGIAFRILDWFLAPLFM